MRCYAVGARMPTARLPSTYEISAFDARIVAKHSAENAAVIRNLTGMANNLNQLTKLSHQTGFYRTKNIVMELLVKLKEVLSNYKAEERRSR